MEALRSIKNVWLQKVTLRLSEYITVRFFSPIAKMTSIRFFLSIATTYDLEIEQMDVKTTFLHGDLEKEIYMSQLEHYVVKGKSHLVCKLKKSLYGLK